jgi:PPM family protein phosphatase
MAIKTFGLSDIGKKRGRNEDSYLLNESLGLFVVADGMGGHSGGEFASRFAVSTIEEVIQSMNMDPEATVISGVNEDGSKFGDRLRYAIEVASQKIYDQAIFEPELKGMGTTVVALLVDETKACIANVGDSRVYLIREGVIKQITEDHSLVSEQMRAGVLSAQDAKTHKLKNIITRSVGYQEEVNADLFYVELKKDDILVMCTDGLTNLLDDTCIQDTVLSHQGDLEAACRQLVSKANDKGGDDNITVVVCHVIDTL